MQRQDGLEMAALGLESKYEISRRFLQKIAVRSNRVLAKRTLLCDRGTFAKAATGGLAPPKSQMLGVLYGGGAIIV